MTEESRDNSGDDKRVMVIEEMRENKDVEDRDIFA